MRLSPTVITPIHKTRTVGLEPAAAFELFTTRMGSWWPLTTHSIAQEKAIGVRFEGRVGGRVVELTEDGTEHPWADVLAWDPPHRFLLAWHPSIDPDAASMLDVRFISIESGTRVEIEHHGWEEFGSAEGASLRDQYDPGWEAVLSRLEAYPEWRAS